jgi:ATP-binding cassette subfamily A (ABC1) protein 3
MPCYISQRLTIVAGKSTTISMLRGETQPSGSNGGLFIQGISVSEDQYRARFHLGVCPQFDAIDVLNVREHLTFYARIRGVKDTQAAVDAMVSNVGLQPFANRMADKLSGGNKRKLSLAIALIGDPEVVLLDEPSSGMDPLAKRNMWMTLAKFRPGRSILLTTHSMEEADALASRVGVISKRLLDVGTIGHLRAKHGDGFHVHIVMRSAPNTSDDEMAGLRGWMEHVLPGTTIEGLPYHGQLRFNVPIVHFNNFSPPDGEISHNRPRAGIERSVASLFVLLEENKAAQGIEFCSVSPATFDEVFIKVIKKHNVSDTDDEATRRRAGLK